MIFLVVFGLIGLVVVVLNIMDSSNLEKIEQELKANLCQNIIYSKGTYKGICKEEIIQIDNGFSVDVQKDKRVIKLNKIENINKDKLSIILNDDYKIEFKEEKNLEVFYKSLKGKVNK